MPKGKRADPKPPAHLSADAKAWWRATVAGFELDAHHVKLLLAACEAWDRMVQARGILKREGPVFEDRFGAPRKHPAVAIEENARAQFVRCVSALDLDGAEEPGVERPPRHRGRFIRRTRRE